MGHYVIEYSAEAKYLGITLDQCLTFTPHIKQKVRAAKGLLNRVSNTVGRLWGP